MNGHDPTMPGGRLYEYYKCDPKALAKVLESLPEGSWVRTNSVGNLSVMNSEDELIGWVNVRSNEPCGNNPGCVFVLFLSEA